MSPYLGGVCDHGYNTRWDQRFPPAPASGRLPLVHAGGQSRCRRQLQPCDGPSIHSLRL